MFGGTHDTFNDWLLAFVLTSGISYVIEAENVRSRESHENSARVQ
jgi:hypothetical protein